MMAFGALTRASLILPNSSKASRRPLSVSVRGRFATNALCSILMSLPPPRSLSVSRPNAGARNVNEENAVVQSLAQAGTLPALLPPAQTTKSDSKEASLFLPYKGVASLAMWSARVTICVLQRGNSRYVLPRGNSRCQEGTPHMAELARLLEAASSGDRATATAILNSNCDINAVDAEGWSPLILASKVPPICHRPLFIFPFGKLSIV